MIYCLIGFLARTYLVLACFGRKGKAIPKAVKVGDVYVSEQLSHDDSGNIVEPGNMEAQMRHAYANIRKM